MNISEVRKAGVVILGLSGRLDASSVKTFQEKFLTNIDGGDRRFIIDFSQLDYISSSGLRVFYQLSAKLKPNGGKIVFCCLSGDVKRVFDIVDMAADFPVALTREEAMDNLK